MESLAGFSSLAIDRVQFVDLCPENWKCDRCGNLVKNIIKTVATFRIDDEGFQKSLESKYESNSRCPHKFCLTCFNQTTLEDGQVKCPIDSLVIPKTAFSQERLDAETILEKEVFCIHRARGCRKYCPLKEIETHLKNCVYALVTCPLRCGEGIIIKKLASHMVTECPRRTTNCHFCDEDIPIQDKKDHESNCLKRPVLCSYCKRKTLFSELKKHFDVCPVRPRSCRLSIIGCEFVGIKEELESHESVWKHHFEHFVKFCNSKSGNLSDDLKSRLSEILKEIKELTEENISLKKTLAKLSLHFENLDKENSSIKKELVKLEMDCKHKLERISKDQKTIFEDVQRMKNIVLDEAPV